MQQQMAMQGMKQNQFPQAYPNPQQSHVQNVGDTMLHHPAQNQRPVQPANPMEMQQQMANGQPVPNIAQRALQNQNQGQPQFSQQEQQQIMQMAESMAQNVSPEQMNSVQRMIMSIPADQRQQMQSQGINPAHAVFRQHAMKKFVQERAFQQQRVGQGPHPLDRGVVSQQGRPTSQISMRQGQQVPPQATQHHHEPSFDQFLGQQQDALRHQEAGQMVVPASQGAPPKVRGTPHPQPQGQFSARPVQPPNNFQQQPPAVWNTPQGLHQIGPPTPQPQIPPQTPNVANMPGQTPQQQALQGQLGGLDNSRAQRTPQQNPNMPTLNRPLNTPNHAQNAQRQAQPNPKTGARNVPSGQQTTIANSQPNVGQQPTQQQRFHRYVANMPEPQRTLFITEFKQRQERRKTEEAAQAAAQAGPSGAPVAPMGGQGTKTQSIPKGNPNIPQPPPNPMNRLNGQAQVSQQTGPPSGARDPQQKFPPIALDENTTRMMDRVEFPRSLLNLAGENAKVPEHIKQWGQLKQWVLQNSNILPPESIQKVMGLQSIVYQQKVAQNNQQREALNQAQSQGNTKPAQPGVAPAAQMVAPNSSQTPVQGSNAQAPNSSTPVLPPPTMHEVTAARAQLPAEMRTVSDEQLRMMILHKRRTEYFKAMQGQTNLTPQQQHQQQQNQMNLIRVQQQINGQQAQGSMQPNQHSQIQPPQRGQNQQTQPGQQWPQPQTVQKITQSNAQQAKQPQPSRSGPQASVPQSNQKNGKRNNNSDDVIEVPDPKLSQQQTRPPNNKGPQPQPRIQPPLSNALSQITPEKYNSLPHEQKARLQEQRRLQIDVAQRANAQRLGPNVLGQRPAEAVNHNVVPNVGRDGRVIELKSEVLRNMPARQPIPMSPNTRARMIEKLKNAGVMSQRLERSLPLYLSLSKDEEKTKDLLRSVS